MLLILGVLVGLAVPRYMESQKAARARTFAANVRQIVSALEAYRMDHTTGTYVGYPQSLADLRTEYFTQEPVNPYTGVSMLDGSGVDYTVGAGNLDYTLLVTQADVDNVDNNDTTTTLCAAIPTMLPTMSCSQSQVGNEDFSNLLDDFTYESRIDGFTPRVLSANVQTITETVGGVSQTGTFIKTVLEQPPEIIHANYKIVMFSSSYPGLDVLENFARETFGVDNVTVLYSFVDQNVTNALSSIEQAIVPSNMSPPYLVFPVVIILDEDGTLLATFVWPVDSTNEDQLFAIATLGKGYSGVYIPLPIFGLTDDYNIDPQSFTLLTDQQKIQIRNALQLVYPIITNVD